MCANSECALKNDCERYAEITGIPYLLECEYGEIAKFILLEEV